MVTDIPPLSINSLTELLKSCSESLGSSLSSDNHKMLGEWYVKEFNRSAEFKNKLMELAPTNWAKAIDSHRAHNHPWYDYIVESLDINNMASFLLENQYYPVFLKMLEKIKAIQFINNATHAVQENIDDEFQPRPHAELMRRLMEAVKKRAQEPIAIDSYYSLINRTLVFYYGYYKEPWHLVGSVFTTEKMGTHRVICMQKGLKRMGLTDYELAFTIIHSECDEHHANDWLQRVIIPSIEAQPELKSVIASGIADCLDSSAEYLDYVLYRAQLKMAG